VFQALFSFILTLDSKSDKGEEIGISKDSFDGYKDRKRYFASQEKERKRETGN
jgi:hypothetical protein